MALRAHTQNARGRVTAQGEFFDDTIWDALGAAARAAGTGLKKVAHQLWPTMDEELAANRLRNGLNPEHAQKLCISEILMIARLAKDAGDHSLMEYIARDLGYEAKPLSCEEGKKRAKKQRIAALLAEVSKLNDDE